MTSTHLKWVKQAMCQGILTRVPKMSYIQCFQISKKKKRENTLLKKAAFSANNRIIKQCACFGNTHQE